MKARLSFLRRLALTGAAAFLLTAGANRAHAVFIFTLQQIGNNVTITGSGSLNTTGLASAGSVGGSNFRGSPALLLFGAAGFGTNYPNVLTGPASFGSSSLTSLTSITGDYVGLYSTGTSLAVPSNYVSNSALSDTATIANQTFATLGFTPGTYTYNLGNGDSLIVTSLVPEPSTWALLGVGVAGLGVVTLRRRASAAARA